MKRFLTSTAVALVLGTSAFAAGHTSAFSEMTFDKTVNVNASGLIDARIYVTEADINNDTIIPADGEKEWDDIGEVNEIVLTRDGKVQSVIVGVGGFIGIGERDVAIDMSQLKFVSDGEDQDEYFLVVNASAAGVKDAPAYERTGMQAMDMDTDRAMLKAPMIEREGYTTVQRDDLTTEDLTGARVYGPDPKPTIVSYCYFTQIKTVDIHQSVRRHNLKFHQVQHIGPARDNHRAVLCRRRCGICACFRAGVIK